MLLRASNCEIEFPPPLTRLETLESISEVAAPVVSALLRPDVFSAMDLWEQTGQLQHVDAVIIYNTISTISEITARDSRHDETHSLNTETGLRLIKFLEAAIETNPLRVDALRLAGVAVLTALPNHLSLTVISLALTDHRAAAALVQVGLIPLLALCLSLVPPGACLPGTDRPLTSEVAGLLLRAADLAGSVPAITAAAISSAALTGLVRVIAAPAVHPGRLHVLWAAASRMLPELGAGNVHATTARRQFALANGHALALAAVLTGQANAGLLLLIAGGGAAAAAAAATPATEADTEAAVAQLVNIYTTSGNTWPPTLHALLTLPPGHDSALAASLVNLTSDQLAHALPTPSQPLRMVSAWVAAQQAVGSAPPSGSVALPSLRAAMNAAVHPEILADRTASALFDDHSRLQTGERRCPLPPRPTPAPAPLTTPATAASAEFINSPLADVPFIRSPVSCRLREMAGCEVGLAGLPVADLAATLGATGCRVATDPTVQRALATVIKAMCATLTADGAAALQDGFRAGRGPVTVLLMSLWRMDHMAQVTVVAAVAEMACKGYFDTETVCVLARLVADRQTASHVRAAILEVLPSLTRQGTSEAVVEALVTAVRVHSSPAPPHPLVAVPHPSALPHVSAPSLAPAPAPAPAADFRREVLTTLKELVEQSDLVRLTLTDTSGVLGDLASTAVHLAHTQDAAIVLDIFRSAAEIKPLSVLHALLCILRTHVQSVQQAALQNSALVMVWAIFGACPPAMDEFSTQGGVGIIVEAAQYAAIELRRSRNVAGARATWNDEDDEDNYEYDDIACPTANIEVTQPEPQPQPEPESEAVDTDSIDQLSLFILYAIDFLGGYLRSRDADQRKFITDGSCTAIREPLCALDLSNTRIAARTLKALVMLATRTTIMAPNGRRKQCPTGYIVQPAVLTMLISLVAQEIKDVSTVAASLAENTLAAAVLIELMNLIDARERTANYLAAHNRAVLAGDQEFMQTLFEVTTPMFVRNHPLWPAGAAIFTTLLSSNADPSTMRPVVIASIMPENVALRGLLDELVGRPPAPSAYISLRNAAASSISTKYTKPLTFPGPRGWTLSGWLLLGNDARTTVFNVFPDSPNALLRIDVKGSEIAVMGTSFQGVTCVFSFPAITSCIASGRWIHMIVSHIRNSDRGVGEIVVSINGTIQRRPCRYSTGIQQEILFALGTAVAPMERVMPATAPNSACSARSDPESGASEAVPTLGIGNFSFWDSGISDLGIAALCMLSPDWAAGVGALTGPMLSHPEPHSAVMELIQQSVNVNEESSESVVRQCLAALVPLESTMIMQINSARGIGSVQTVVSNSRLRGAISHMRPHVLAVSRLRHSGRDGEIDDIREAGRLLPKECARAAAAIINAGSISTMVKSRDTMDLYLLALRDSVSAGRSCAPTILRRLMNIASHSAEVRRFLDVGGGWAVVRSALIRGGDTISKDIVNVLVEGCVTRGLDGIVRELLAHPALWAHCSTDLLDVLHTAFITHSAHCGNETRLHLMLTEFILRLPSFPCSPLRTMSAARSLRATMRTVALAQVSNISPELLARDMGTILAAIAVGLNHDNTENEFGAFIADDLDLQLASSPGSCPDDQSENDDLESDFCRGCVYELIADLLRSAPPAAAVHAIARADMLQCLSVMLNRDRHGSGSQYGAAAQCLRALITALRIVDASDTRTIPTELIRSTLSTIGRAPSISIDSSETSAIALIARCADRTTPVDALTAAVERTAGLAMFTLSQVNPDMDEIIDRLISLIRQFQRLPAVATIAHMTETGAGAHLILRPLAAIAVAAQHAQISMLGKPSMSVCAEQAGVLAQTALSMLASMCTTSTSAALAWRLFDDPLVTACYIRGTTIRGLPWNSASHLPPEMGHDSVLAHTRTSFLHHVIDYEVVSGKPCGCVTATLFALAAPTPATADGLAYVDGSESHALSLEQYEECTMRLFEAVETALTTSLSENLQPLVTTCRLNGHTGQNRQVAVPSEVITCLQKLGTFPYRPPAITKTRVLLPSETLASAYAQISTIAKAFTATTSQFYMGRSFSYPSSQSNMQNPDTPADDLALQPPTAPAPVDLPPLDIVTSRPELHSVTASALPQSSPAAVALAALLTLVSGSLDVGDMDRFRQQMSMACTLFLRHPLTCAAFAFCGVAEISELLAYMALYMFQLPLARAEAAADVLTAFILAGTRIDGATGKVMPTLGALVQDVAPQFITTMDRLNGIVEAVGSSSMALALAGAAQDARWTRGGRAIHDAGNELETFEQRCGACNLLVERYLATGMNALRHLVIGFAAPTSAHATDSSVSSPDNRLQVFPSALYSTVPVTWCAIQNRVNALWEPVTYSIDAPGSSQAAAAAAVAAFDSIDPECYRDYGAKWAVVPDMGLSISGDVMWELDPHEGPLRRRARLRPFIGPSEADQLTQESIMAAVNGAIETDDNNSDVECPYKQHDAAPFLVESAYRALVENGEPTSIVSSPPVSEMNASPMPAESVSIHSSSIFDTPPSQRIGYRSLSISNSSQAANDDDIDEPVPSLAVPAVRVTAPVIVPIRFGLTETHLHVDLVSIERLDGLRASMDLSAFKTANTQQVEPPSEYTRHRSLSVVRTAASPAMEAIEGLSSPTIASPPPAQQATGDTLVSLERLVALSPTKDERMNPCPLMISLEDVVAVHKRHYIVACPALEFFFSSGLSVYVAFESERVCAAVLTLLGRYHDRGLMPQLTFLWSRSRHTQRLDAARRAWVAGDMSNFEYIMELNTLAGRSYNDISSWPVFPAILSDWSSSCLDLTSPSTYRDLSLPMGAIGQERLAHFTRVLEETTSMEPEELGFVGGAPYMYGHLYTHSAVTSYYLWRLEPFASMQRALQSGAYELPARTFSSFSDLWRHAAYSSRQEVLEMIPELFTTPETVEMHNNYALLPHPRTGRPVGAVELPPWANGSAEKFCQLHRAALESPHVRQNLPKWIDMIFGVNQRGKNARRTNNIFAGYSYTSVSDLQTMPNVQRDSVIHRIFYFGHVPDQLFPDSAHPQSKQTPPVVPMQTVMQSMRGRFVEVGGTRRPPIASIELSSRPVPGAVLITDVMLAASLDLQQSTLHGLGIAARPASTGTCCLPGGEGLILHYGDMPDGMMHVKESTDILRGQLHPTHIGIPAQPDIVQAFSITTNSWMLVMAVENVIYKARLTMTSATTANSHIVPLTSLITTSRIDVSNPVQPRRKTILRRSWLAGEETSRRSESIRVDTASCFVCERAEVIAVLDSHASALSTSRQWGVIAVGTGNGQVYLCDLNRKAALWRVQIGTGRVMAVAVSADTGHIAASYMPALMSAEPSCEIMVWNINGRPESHTRMCGVCPSLDFTSTQKGAIAPCLVIASRVGSSSSIKFMQINDLNVQTVLSMPSDDVEITCVAVDSAAHPTVVAGDSMGRLIFFSSNLNK